MPNDLKTQRNLLNSRPESRPESQRQKLASSGFTASIWTLSGVVLVACSNVEDFLGLDDGGGGGGGGTLHVHSSPVQGARIYFDVDGGGVSADEMAAQDAEYPQGFISNAEGRVLGVPNEFYGMPFEAHLDGAFDADTGESLGSGILRSIPNNVEDGQHLLASPITHHIANQAGALADVVEQIDPNADTTAAVNEFLSMVSDPTNYDGRSGIDILARYLDGGQTDAAAEFARVLGDSATVTFAPAPAESAVTISANDEYITTIEVESPASAVQYRIVAGSDAFTVNERGVISVREGMTPTDTTLQISVSNGDGDSEMVSVDITVETAPELTAPADTTAEVAENAPGGDLITGIMAPASVTSWVIRAPGGLSDKFAVEDDSGNHKLVLKSTETLDHEAFTNGVFDVQVWGETTAGVRSNTLTFTITVTPANDAPVFLPAPEDNDQKLVGDGGTIETLESARGMVAQVRAHDADRDSVTYEITGGNVALLDGNGDPTGEMLFSIDGDGAITVNAPLDYDTAPTSYTLMIGVSDSLDADGNSEQTFTADATITVTIDLTDANDNAPMVTADAGTIRTTAGNTADMNTGYSITVTDADTVGTLMVTSNDRRFTFERDDPNSDTWNLVLLAGEAVTAGTITLGYTATDGVNPTSDTITLMAVDTPVAFAAVDAGDLDIAENSDTWTVTVTATSEDSDSDGSDSAIASYEILEVRDAEGNVVQGNGVFSITNAGVISISGALNYEDSAFYTLNIQATDTPESGVSGHDEADTGTIPLVVRVQNVEEGEATYEIVLTDDNGATVTDLAEDVTLTPMVATADPDGIDRVVSYLWSRGDGSSLNGDATGATYTLMAGDSTTATYSVTITYMDGTGKTEEVEASTSSVSWDVVPSYDPVANPLTDGEAPMANDPVIPMTAISASGGDGKIEYSIEDPSGVFQIHPNSGALSVSENGPAVWDFETTPSYEIYIIATDVDDGSTMGTQDTARQRVVITVQDANDAPVVEGVQVTANDPLAMAGTPTITGLTGTTADEYIEGTAGADTIASGGGADHIIGGTGNDGITLSEAADNVETIYHRFSSSNSGDFAPTDGYDTITNFRRGEDKIVLIDTDSSVITLTDFLSAANTAGSGGNVEIVPLFDSVTGTTLIGVQIGFGSTNAGRFLRIEYATDSQVANARAAGQGAIEAAGVPYLGTLGEGLPSGGLIEGDNSLLLNYFGDTGNTNLQITGDDITANLGIDVLISEKRNAEDGFFATVSATDPDAAPNNEIMRYDISGGTGSALFTVDVMGRISVSDGVNVGEGGRTTLDYDTTSEYTLEITATDAGGAVSDPTTITIGLIENGEAEYSLALTGTTYTATRDTADPDGVDDTVDVTYQWYTTPDGGTTKNDIATSGTNSISDTTSETLDVMGYTPPSGQTYGVTITYTDGVGIDESVDAVLASVTLDDISRTSTADTTLPASASVHTLAPTVVGGGTVTYVLSGGDSSLFTEFQGKIFPMPTLTLTKTTYSFTITATEDVGGTSDTATFTLTTGYSEASPAIIPDRQAFAHQDPYEPNDDQNDQTNQDNPQTPPDIM